MTTTPTPTPRRRRPGDQLAAESKTRTDRLPDDRRAQGRPRPWYCRSCGSTEHAVVLPSGWYALSRQQGELRDDTGAPKHTRLGVYCSLACLASRLPLLLAVEHQLDSGELLDQRAVDRQLNGRAPR